MQNLLMFGGVKISWIFRGTLAATILSLPLGGNATTFRRSTAIAREIDSTQKPARLRRPLLLVAGTGESFPYFWVSQEEQDKLYGVARFLNIDIETPLWDGETRLYRQIGVSVLKSISITRWILNIAGELEIHHTTEYSSYVVQEGPEGELKRVESLPLSESISRITKVPYWPNDLSIGFALDPEIPADFKKVREAFNLALGRRAPHLTGDLRRRFLTRQNIRRCQGPLRKG